MAKRSSPKIGDVFEIPLSDGRKAYGQYVYENMGPIIRIFNYFTFHDEEPDLDIIEKSKLLFPPIHAAVTFAIKSGMWKVVGKLAANDYVFKGFLVHSEVLPMPQDKREPVIIQSWSLWDGQKNTELGEKLPEEYQDYEAAGIYPPDLITKRIETGFNMFEYPKKHNRFLTEEEVKRKLKAN